MVEQSLNQIIEQMYKRANIPLPEIGGEPEPLAANLEELAEVLGATEIDPETLDPLEIEQKRDE